jgi:hypothetical protein
VNIYIYRSGDEMTQKNELNMEEAFKFQFIGLLSVTKKYAKNAPNIFKYHENLVPIYINREYNNIYFESA